MTTKWSGSCCHRSRAITAAVSARFAPAIRWGLGTDASTCTDRAAVPPSRTVRLGSMLLMKVATAGWSPAPGVSTIGERVQAVHPPPVTESAQAAVGLLAGASARAITRSGASGLTRNVSRATATDVSTLLAPASRCTSAWADSVTGGGWTAWTRSPIVLTPGAGIHPAVATFISNMEPSRTVLLGGTAALSVQVEASVPNPQRMAGANRAETAAVIARDLWQHEPDHFVVINGYQRDGWAYGLPAAGLSADAQAPLLLAEVSSVPPETIGQVSTPCGGGAQVDTLLVGASPQLSVEVALLLDGVDGGACSAP